MISDGKKLLRAEMQMSDLMLQRKTKVIPAFWIPKSRILIRRFDRTPFKLMFKCRHDASPFRNSLVETLCCYYRLKHNARLIAGGGRRNRKGWVLPRCTSDCQRCPLWPVDPEDRKSKKLSLTAQPASRLNRNPSRTGNTLLHRAGPPAASAMARTHRPGVKLACRINRGARGASLRLLPAEN